jgi:hypothetical protein
MTASKRRKRKRGGSVLAQLGLRSPPAKRRSSGVLGAVKRPSWKVVGLAGVAGVAATGVVVARNRRAHAPLEPDELRERLRGRLAEVDNRSPGGSHPLAQGLAGHRQGAGGAASDGDEPAATDLPT